MKLNPTPEQFAALSDVQTEFNQACNQIVPYAVDNRCWNRVALHHLAYRPIRKASRLGSQMVCNAVKMVADAYKVLKLKKSDDVPTIHFRPLSSVHYDARTFSLKDETVSLSTLAGRIYVALALGDFQRSYRASGTVKEAKLVRRGKRWFFNLVLDLPDTPPTDGGNAMGVDLGEKTIAATSTGKVLSGGTLRHQRDTFLALRRRLQRNGSQSAKQLLRKVSGREARHVTHINHEVSKAIVQEAIRSGAQIIVMEDLINIRKRIKAGKRVRTRLHRWSWRALETFVQYKAEAAGLRVVYANPAYTSQTCSTCGCLGTRKTHRFSCSCGNFAHSDGNAARNLAKLAEPVGSARGAVTRPTVAAALG